MARRAYDERIRSFCTQRGIGLSPADLATPADETVLQLLRRGSLLA